MKYIPCKVSPFPLVLPTSAKCVCSRIWHVDEDGMVSTPIDFTATVNYINFLNHSDQACGPASTRRRTVHMILSCFGKRNHIGMHASYVYLKNCCPIMTVLLATKVCHLRADIRAETPPIFYCRNVGVVFEMIALVKRHRTGCLKAFRDAFRKVDFSRDRRSS